MSSSRWFRPRILVPALLGVAFVALVVVRVMQATAPVEPEPTVEQIRQQRGIPVRVTAATEGPIEVWRRFNGTVSGVQEGVVRARSDAQVLEVPVSVGSRVQRGQVLVRLSGEAEEARLRAAEVAARQAARNVERLQPLREAGALSEQAWEQAQNQLELAEAERDAARDMLVLTSPLTGIVTELPARPGMVPAAGDPLARVADLSRLVVRLAVSTSEAAELAVGDAARVAGAESGGVALPAAGGGAAAPRGTVRRIALQADPQTRLVEVEVEFPATSSLLAGTLATVEVLVAEREGVVRVPRQAVVQQSGAGGGEAAVWLVEGDAVTRRPVEVGLETAEQVEIASGIAPGDRVVVEGGSLLQEGARIRDVNGGDRTGG